MFRTDDWSHSRTMKEDTETIVSSFLQNRGFRSAEHGASESTKNATIEDLAADILANSADASASQVIRSRTASDSASKTFGEGYARLIL